ncbi:hypothetical protein ACKKBG_A04175 [Auxenochlorella protothecoides x Auxenochlorella symbiontica]|uniref:Protein YIP n=1 Tax=Auxenochlorella protothecoides TaxID=3075 RepID=A0A1D1ZQ55_AUXPR
MQVFTIALAIALAVGPNKDMSATFSLVFALVSVGAIVLTLNAVLLGGTIGFFQSLCLLGYCIFPLTVVALVCMGVTSLLARWIIVPLGIAWCAWASVPFIGGAVPANRRALAVFPLVLLYTTLGWLALIS